MLHNLANTNSQNYIKLFVKKIMFGYIIKEMANIPNGDTGDNCEHLFDDEQSEHSSDCDGCDNNNCQCRDTGLI